MEWMRDGVWQFVGALVTVVAIIIGVASDPLRVWLIGFVVIIFIIFAIVLISKSDEKPSMLGESFLQKHKPNRTNNGKYKVSVEEACIQLKGLSLSSRVNAINDISPNLPNQITGQEAANLLGSLSGSSRVAAIKILATKILTPQSDKEVDNLLAGLTGTSRQQAIQELNKNWKSNY